VHLNPEIHGIMLVSETVPCLTGNTLSRLAWGAIPSLIFQVETFRIFHICFVVDLVLACYVLCLEL
jgi:hypothetical protein